MELEELYDRIYRYCYFHTGRKELAEDLTQETFLRFFHRNPSLHPERQLLLLITRQGQMIFCDVQNMDMGKWQSAKFYLHC